MILEVGKIYETRGGGTVIIEDDISEKGFVAVSPFFGHIKDGDQSRLAFFTSNGIYNLEKQTRFDIVKELNHEQN